MSRRGWLLFIAMGVIWGVPYLLIKVAIDELTPAMLVFTRTVLAGLLLVPIAAARGQLRPLLALWRPVLAYTAAEVTVPWFFLSVAEQRLSSSLTGLLIAGVPLVGAVLAAVTRTERLGPWRIVGLFVGFAGVAALVGIDVRGGDLWAIAAILVVVVGYAVGPYILGHHLVGAPSLGVIAASMALTAVVYAPFAVVQVPHAWPSAKAIAAVVGLALICTVLAFLVFFALIAEVGPTRATVITYVNPAVAVALGVALLGEPLTVGIVVGFVLVLAGSVLATGRTGTRDSTEPVTIIQ